MIGVYMSLMLSVILTIVFFVLYKEEMKKKEKDRHNERLYNALWGIFLIFSIPLGLHVISINYGERIENYSKKLFDKIKN